MQVFQVIGTAILIVAVALLVAVLTEYVFKRKR